MRRALVRLVTPIVWRVPGHGARKLYGFAGAEQGSRIDLLQAAHRTTSQQRRALYLRHALDEARHAGMFWRRSTDLRVAEGRAPFPPPRADTEDLFERLGELRFLAFVHRGEQRGRRQFELYARHFDRRGDARTRTLFEAILSDEHRHEGYTRELLVELAGSERAARAELRRAALWEAWRSWRRAGRALAGAIYTLAMIAIYLVAGPIAAVAARLTRRRSGWQLPAPAVSLTTPTSMPSAAAAAPSTAPTSTPSAVFAASSTASTSMPSVVSSTAPTSMPPAASAASPTPVTSPTSLPLSEAS